MASYILMGLLTVGLIVGTGLYIWAINKYGRGK